MVLNVIKIAQRKFVNTLCPDICKIVDVASTSPTFVNGIAKPGPTIYYAYNGSEDIPCRIDQARAFRPASMRAETSEVEEYSLELPVDLKIGSQDIVIISGDQYHFRKLSDEGVWNISQVGLLMRVTKVKEVL